MSGGLINTFKCLSSSRRARTNATPSEYLEPLLLDLTKQLLQLLERQRVCNDLKRQFNVVDGQQWQRQ